MESRPADHPLMRLPVEDLDLIVRFVLASGSLKELGRQYGVSYPTMRARLDRLIERLRAVTEEREIDPFIDELADAIEAGEITVSAARRLRALHSDQISRLRGD